MLFRSPVPLFKRGPRIPQLPGIVIAGLQQSGLLVKAIDVLVCAAHGGEDAQANQEHQGHTAQRAALAGRVAPQQAPKHIAAQKKHKKVKILLDQEQQREQEAR